MDISYKRNPNQNYMIIEGDAVTIGYEEKMLQENTIDVLLSFYTMEINGYLQFWYDISGKKSLRDFFDQEGVTEENLRLIFRLISEAYIRLSEYLIREEGIYMDPDTVFLEKHKNCYDVFLCYCPLDHCDYLEQLRNIMKYIIAAVDHRQAEITELCYELFAITEQKSFSLADILLRLEENIEEQKPEILKEDILNAANEVGEDFFYEEMEEEMEREKGGFLHAVFSKLKKWREKFFHKKEELFPLDDELQDLEFDEEVVSTETILLAENPNFCCGKLMYESGGNGDKDYIIS
ncbi:MAG: DUF6382 domain-containing protein, partial [Lachnospiraceae bacterium]|nr:DUF6382 domain-containing protein [Lachnospiraceae bacterium]